MKQSEQDKSDLLISLQQLSEADQINPYAILAVFDIPESALLKLAEHFELSLKKSFEVSYLQKKNCNNGEHKLQTVDLLAAAICVHQNFPQARMNLALRHDFLLETRNLKSEFDELSSNLPAGYLQISSACLTFLSQAGFHVSTSDVPKRMQASQVVGMAEQFFSHLQSAKILKGA